MLIEKADLWLPRGELAPRPEPNGLSSGPSYMEDLLQGWGGEGFKVLFFNFLGQACSTARQGTAELADGPGCWVLLPALPLLAFLLLL